MVNHVILVVLTAVLVPLSTARLTRIINDDLIAESFREWVGDKFGMDSKVYYAVAVCFWCLSIWVAGLHCLAALLAWTLLGPLPWHVAALLLIPATLAVSDIAGRILKSEGI